MIAKCQITIAVLTLWTLQAQAAPAVQLSTAAERMAAEYPAGQVVSAPLLVASGSDAGVFGVELTVSAGSDDFAVRSVTFNPAFSQELGEVSPAVANAPAADGSAASAPTADAAGAPSTPTNASFRAVRSQAAASLDPSLAASATPVPFATVELEIKNPRPFTSTLVIHYRGSVVGAGADRAALSGNGPTNTEGAAPASGNSPTYPNSSGSTPTNAEADVSRLVIEITNTAPPPAPEPAVEVWQQDQATLSAERPKRGHSGIATTIMAMIGQHGPRIAPARRQRAH